MYLDTYWVHKSSVFTKIYVQQLEHLHIRLELSQHLWPQHSLATEAPKWRRIISRLQEFAVTYCRIIGSSALFPLLMS